VSPLEVRRKVFTAVSCRPGVTAPCRKSFEQSRSCVHSFSFFCLSKPQKQCRPSIEDVTHTLAAEQFSCRFTPVRDAKAVPSNLPLTLHLLQHEQLLVSLLAGLACGILLLSSCGRRSSKSVLVRNNNDLLDSKSDGQGDGFEALVVPGLDCVVSDLGLEGRRHDDAVRSVELDDVWDGRGDQGIAVGVEQSFDRFFVGRHCSVSVLSRRQNIQQNTLLGMLLDCGASLTYEIDLRGSLPDNTYLYQQPIAPGGDDLAYPTRAVCSSTAIFAVAAYGQGPSQSALTKH